MKKILALWIILLCIVSMTGCNGIFDTKPSPSVAPTKTSHSQTHLPTPSPTPVPDPKDIPIIPKSVDFSDKTLGILSVEGSVKTEFVEGKEAINGTSLKLHFDDGSNQTLTIASSLFYLPTNTFAQVKFSYRFLIPPKEGIQISASYGYSEDSKYCYEKTGTVELQVGTFDKANQDDVLNIEVDASEVVIDDFSIKLLPKNIPDIKSDSTLYSTYDATYYKDKNARVPYLLFQDDIGENYAKSGEVVRDLDGDGINEKLRFKVVITNDDEGFSSIQITLSVNNKSIVYNDGWYDGLNLYLLDFDKSDKYWDICITRDGTDMGSSDVTVYRFVNGNFTEDYFDSSLWSNMIVYDQQGNIYVQDMYGYNEQMNYELYGYVKVYNVNTKKIGYITNVELRKKIQQLRNKYEPS